MKNGYYISMPIKKVAQTYFAVVCLITLFLAILPETVAEVVALALLKALGVAFVAFIFFGLAAYILYFFLAASRG